MKKENLPLVNGGIVTSCDYVTKNDKGEFKMSDKNKFYFELLLRGLKLEKIGYNFVIDFKYIDKYDLLATYSETKNGEFDNSKYYGIEKELINLLNKINLLLVDRQLGIRHTVKGYTLLQVYDNDVRLQNVFVRNKNSSCVSTVRCIDPVTKEIYTIEQKTKKGMFLFDTSRTDEFGKLSQEFIDDFVKQISTIDSEFVHGILNALQELPVETEQKKEKKA